MAGFHLQGILVKNTFVTIEDPSVDDASSCSSHRRSSSAPPLTSRHGMSNSLSGDCSPTCSISGRMDSSASTDIDDLTVCLQDPSEAGSCLQRCASDEQLPPWEPELLCVPKGRAALSSSAQAYAPRMPPPSAAPAWMLRIPPPRPAWEEFAAIVSEMLARLQGTGLAANMQVNRSSFGWQVVVEVRQRDLCKQEHILGIAKASLLAAAEVSFGSFVLGYGKKPFVMSPLGFSAMLGHVVDQSKACWNLLQQGCCSQEGHCCWQHPEARATVGVMVVPWAQDSAHVYV
mmetsp:Transcript_13793/g.24927  ORF Transcript_13793/g.24927 Transcript_13793/m.24927 type:complete len:288 (-) Transcript_13793:141-1004(-)